MSAAARVTPFRRSYADPMFLFAARRPMAPASAQMIDEVITHADVAVRMSGQRLKLRLSAGMIEQLQAQGKLGEDAFIKAIQSKNRLDLGPTAPACGLCLLRVDYHGLP